MKRIVMLITGIIACFALQAQPVKNKGSNAGPVLSAAAVKHGYGCPVCMWNSHQPGKCTFHNKVSLVPDGWYYCKTDVSVISASPGKCPRCSNEMTKMMTGILPVARAGFVTVQDTSRKTNKKPAEEGYDQQQQKELRKDPDNRIRTKPKSVPLPPDSTAAPGSK